MKNQKKNEKKNGKTLLSDVRGASFVEKLIITAVCGIGITGGAVAIRNASRDRAADLGDNISDIDSDTGNQ